MNKKNLNESGRSMVEMLGVLAVMGLLSVMAFAGFRIALNKHYANEILNEGNKRAVVVAGQIGLNQASPSLHEFANNTFSGGTFDTSVATNPQTEQFAIKISNVPEVVCQNILSMIADHTMLRRLASEGNMAQTITTCTESESNYLMVYNDDLTLGDKVHVCQTVADCKTACATCENNICTNECEIAPTTCTSNSECANAGVCAGCVIPDGATTGTCQYACEEVEYLESDESTMAYTNYIDTGIVLKKSDSIEGCVQLTSVVPWAIIGFDNYPPGESPYKDYIRLMIANTDTNRVNFAFFSCASPATYQNFNALQRITFVGNLNRYVVNGTSYTTASACKEGTNHTLKLMYFGGGGGKMWYFKIKDANDALIRDFIPVLDPYGVPAMLDRVEQKLYYNEGSGEFKTHKDATN